MTFPRVKIGGWGVGDPLTSAQQNQLDIDHTNALDGLNGGTYTLGSKLLLDGTGGVQLNKLFRNYRALTGNYTVDASGYDYVIGVDTTTATPSYAVTLPAIVVGRVLLIKHTAGTPPLLVTPNGSNTIDGINASYTLQQIGSAIMLLGASASGAGSWIIIGKV